MKENGIPSKIFLKKKIIVCCGSGGVGKTTTAAAVALKAASLGKKTVVLTIDPARRLATAMGLQALDNVPREIPLIDPPSTGKAGSSGSSRGENPDSPPRTPHRGNISIGDVTGGESGKLFAMMLDTKRTFDRLIERHMKDPAAREAIYKNALYQHMSNMIAGSQEYMAMERLFELYNDNEFEIMILDTPPTRHALDFLEAPHKMVNITKNSLLKWFLKPSFFAGKVGFGFFQRSTEKILSVFDRLAGLSFLHELAEMIGLMSNLLGGFHDRAQAVQKLLRKDFCGFLLVTSTSSVSIQDSLYFYQQIKGSDLPFMGFVINRIHEDIISNASSEVQSFPQPLKDKVLERLEDYKQLVQRDQKAITLLKKMGGKKALYATVPLFSQDVHNLSGLQKMSEELFL